MVALSRAVSSSTASDIAHRAADGAMVESRSISVAAHHVRSSVGVRPFASRVRPTLTVGGVLASVLLLVTAPASGTAKQARDRFETYPTCDVIGQSHPPIGRRCSSDDAWGAVIIDHKRSETTYRLCIRRPERSRKCFRRRAYGRHQASVSGLWATRGFNDLGRYRFTWRLPGRGVIDRDWIRIREPAAPR